LTPTETLKHEHQILLLVLGAAEREASSIQSTGKVDAEKVGQMVEFFRNFADRCHHAKEEKLLFARMRERGMPAGGGPIAVMLREHDQGRALVGAVADALPAARDGDASAVAAVCESLLAYAQLLRAHIGKEDNVLYPMADQLLTAQDQDELTGAFEKVEAEEMGEGTHEKFHQLAHDLAAG